MEKTAMLKKHEYLIKTGRPARLQTETPVTLESWQMEGSRSTS